jgi:hypothetical protein
MHRGHTPAILESGESVRNDGTGGVRGDKGCGGGGRGKNGKHPVVVTGF